MSDLMLDVNQAAEIKMAARRAGATNADLKTLSEGDMFSKILPVLRRRAEVVMKSILEPLRTLTIPVQPALTTTEQDFRDFGVIWMSDTAKTVLLNRQIEWCREIELRVSNLLEDSLDKSILDELGDKAEISPTHLGAFLNRNRESTEWFIFYVRDVEGTLWAVDVSWDAVSGGWNVNANSVKSSNRWNAGSRVVSRN